MKAQSLSTLLFLNAYKRELKRNGGTYCLSRPPTAHHPRMHARANVKHHTMSRLDTRDRR